MLRVKYEYKELYHDVTKTSCTVTQPSILKLLAFFTHDKNRGKLRQADHVIDYISANLAEDHAKRLDKDNIRDWISSLRKFLKDHDEAWVRDYRVTNAKTAGGYRLEVSDP